MDLLAAGCRRTHAEAPIACDKWAEGQLTTAGCAVMWGRMDKLQAMATFVQIVDRGSLSGASEALDTSLSSVVRTLAGLEKSLGVRLLNRTTRRISLTEEGRHYVERCRRILAEVEDTEHALNAKEQA